MRILVTGAAGFIGHHVVSTLLDNAHAVVGLDRIDETSTLARLPQGHERFKFVWHDLRAPINDLAANMIGPVDAICHLAAPLTSSGPSGTPCLSSWITSSAPVTCWSTPRLSS